MLSVAQLGEYAQPKILGCLGFVEEVNKGFLQAKSSLEESEIEGTVGRLDGNVTAQLAIVKSRKQINNQLFVDFSWKKVHLLFSQIAESKVAGIKKTSILYPIYKLNRLCCRVCNGHHQQS